MEDKTGKVFLTGYIEGFTKIWGGGTRLRKGRKKARRSRKTTAQSRLHSQGSRDCRPSQHRTMDLCCKLPLQLSLDTGCGIAPTATASETTTPKMLLTQKDSPCSASLAPFDWQSRSQISIPCQEKGEVGKEAKTTGRLFSIIWRGWL